MLRLACTTALLLALAAAPAVAADRRWATVNVCDTRCIPTRSGCARRCRRPPRGVSRQIRFRLQWLDGDKWRYVGTADSGWRRIKKAPQSGWSFELAPPERAR